MSSLVFILVDIWKKKWDAKIWRWFVASVDIIRWNTSDNEDQRFLNVQAGYKISFYDEMS